MRNLSLYRKIFVLTLAIVLLTLSAQSIGYSQDVFRVPHVETPLEPRRLSVDEIYDKTIQSLVWIVSGINQDNSMLQGSGVLIDRELRLAVTNHHVVKDVKDNDEIAVFFPVRDKQGILIDERDFYVNKNNLGVLMRLGYAVDGRIIAKEPKTDLAIIQLEGLPDTAREIEHNFNYSVHLNMNNRDQVQIFGNPGGLKLWKWASGFFESVDQGMIKIHAGIYKGNSGGPVLDDQGMLIGIATLSNEQHTAWAVPANHIKDLLNTLQSRHVFSITNNTAFTVHYYTKWSAGSNWKKTSVKSHQIMTHWNSAKNVAEGYPKIYFDHIANDEEMTPRQYHLKTYVRNLGAGVTPSHIKDAREYHFGYNSRTKILDLYDSQKK